MCETFEFNRVYIDDINYNEIIVTFKIASTAVETNKKTLSPNVSV